jgi:exonuclease-1
VNKNKVGGRNQKQQLRRPKEHLPNIIQMLIKELRARGIDYIVSPYEADAQCAFMEQTGMVWGVMTEDTDLIVYGVKNVSI